MSFIRKEDEKGPASSFPVSTGTPERAEAILGKGSKVVGTITFAGPAELDGHLEGEVIAQDRLTIGESAVIQAKVSGAEIIVKGQVNGDIIASRKLSLRRPAKVFGNISTSTLSIEEGVVFEGKSTMSSAGRNEQKAATPKP